MLVLCKGQKLLSMHSLHLIKEDERFSQGERNFITYNKYIGVRTLLAGLTFEILC